MTAGSDPQPGTVDRVRRHLVGLKMPRALEVLDHTVRQLEQGQIAALEAIEILLAEELSLREGRRVKAALKMGRLLSLKTLAGFDFAFQPSLDRNRILTLAQLAFIDRHEVVHFVGQPGCGRLRPAAAGCGRLRPAAARPTSPSRWAWKPSRPAAASISAPWPN